MGRPCLVSTLDAAREVVTSESGLAVDPSDRIALTHAISVLLQDDDTRMHHWGAAIHHYETYYTAGAYQLRLINALSSLPTRREAISSCS